MQSNIDKSVYVFDLFGVVISFDDTIVCERIARHCRDPQTAFRGLEDVVSTRRLITGAMTLNELEDTGKKTINYIYDFGDNWEHRIKIGRITDPVPGELYPRLTEVTGKCPPEDVGGFPGYYGFLDAMADPKHPEHDHLKDWYGGTFDPNQPETDKLKLEVLSLAKRWKPGKPRK